MNRTLALEHAGERRRAARNRKGLGDTPGEVPRILGPVHSGTPV
jgi:hypothetical protein